MKRKKKTKLMLNFLYLSFKTLVDHRLEFKYKGQPLYGLVEGVRKAKMPKIKIRVGENEHLEAVDGILTLDVDQVENPVVDQQGKRKIWKKRKKKAA